jgi:hypothetical protein
MKKYFKLLGIAFMATSLCVAMASCNKDKDNDESDTNGGNYVDLGLPSGTKWKTDNEVNPNKDGNNFYTWDEAVATFGNRLPTEEQLRELKDSCSWTWDGTKKGYDVKGRNGNSIFLPAAGGCSCDGDVDYVGSLGYFWSSTPNGSEYAWSIFFYSGEVIIAPRSLCNGQSVRLVKK